MVTMDIDSTEDLSAIKDENPGYACKHARLLWYEVYIT